MLNAIGVNKWIAYGLGIFAILGSLSVIYLKIKGSGADKEKLKQAEASLERMQKNAQIRARVESATTDSARSVLKNKYGLGRS